MKALLCRQWGTYDVLELEDIDPPVAAKGEVVVDVKAVGLNFFDTLIVQKKYQYQPEFPFSPGAEIAGVVNEIGDGVEGFKPGDRVMGYVTFNGAREQIAVAEQNLVHIPDSLDFTVAAGLLVTYGTTVHALRNRAQLQAGETLAVLGASGGVGQAAVEIGKAMGARVIACASSDEKLEFCKSLGADELLNYSETDLKTGLKDLTGGKGVDVVYDSVGGDFSEAALRATGWNGRFLVVGFAAGTIPKIPLNLVLLKGCQMMGVFWGDHIVREPDLHRDNIETLVNWCVSGKIAPHIYKTWPLAEAKEGLGAIARREVRGKVILTVGSVP